MNQYEGNIRFRELIRQRKDDYSATTNRRVKDTIAREIVEVVMSNEGRFLKKYEEIENEFNFSIPDKKCLLANESLLSFSAATGRDDATGHGSIKIQRKASTAGAVIDDAWVVVNKEIAVEKAKQALRDQEERTNRIDSEHGAILLEPSKRISIKPAKSEFSTSSVVDGALQEHERHAVTITSEINGHEKRQASNRSKMDAIPTGIKQEKANDALDDGCTTKWKACLKGPNSELSGDLDGAPTTKSLGFENNMHQSVTSVTSFSGRQQLVLEEKEKRLKKMPVGTSVSRLRKQQMSKLYVTGDDANDMKLLEDLKESSKSSNEQNDDSRVMQQGGLPTYAISRQHNLQRQSHQRIEYAPLEDVGMYDRSVNLQRNRLLQQIMRNQNEGSVSFPTVLHQTNPYMRQENCYLGAYPDLPSGLNSTRQAQIMLNAALASRYSSISSLVTGELRDGLLGASSPISLTQQYIELLSRSGRALPAFGYQDQQIPSSINASFLESYLLRQSSPNFNIPRTGFGAGGEGCFNDLNSLEATLVALSRRQQSSAISSDPIPASAVASYRRMNGDDVQS